MYEFKSISVKIAIETAQRIRDRFRETGCIDYDEYKKFGDFCYNEEIAVVFDEDDIPELVEDTPIR